MDELYQIIYSLVGKDAFVCETLHVFEGLQQESVGRVLYYTERYKVPVEVVSTEPATASVRTWAYHRSGSPLCWWCLEFAVAECSLCGCFCCGACACSMRAEVRDLLSVPFGALWVECVSCVCK